MNRGLAIAGGVLLGLSFIVPLAMSDMVGAWEDAFVFFLIVLPLSICTGIVGLILLIVGLASGARQQQQQQIVVVTGGSYCTACGQAKGPSAFCTSCGAGA